MQPALSQRVAPLGVTETLMGLGMPWEDDRRTFVSAVEAAASFDDLPGWVQSVILLAEQELDDHVVRNAGLDPESGTPIVHVKRDAEYIRGSHGMFAKVEDADEKAGLESVLPNASVDLTSGAVDPRAMGAVVAGYKLALRDWPAVAATCTKFSLGDPSKMAGVVAWTLTGVDHWSFKAKTSETQIQWNPSLLVVKPDGTTGIDALLQNNADTGWVAKGYDTAAVATHEVGHMVHALYNDEVNQFMVGLEAKAQAFSDTPGPDWWKGRHPSGAAGENRGEWFAELFAMAERDLPPVEAPTAWQIDDTRAFLAGLKTQSTATQQRSAVARDAEYVRGSHGQFAKAEDADFVHSGPIDITTLPLFQQLRDDPSSLVYAPKDPQGDVVLAAIGRVNGFGGPADVVSRSELDRYVAKGEVELIRGGRADFAEQFKHGEMYWGKGVYGNGVYAVMKEPAGSDDRDVRIAESYARDARSASLDGWSGSPGDGNTFGLDPGAITRMTIKDGARTISDTDVVSAILKERMAADHLETRDQMAVYDFKLRDPGRWAMAHGYDVMTVPDQRYAVILNRTAVRVQDENVPYREEPYDRISHPENFASASNG